MTPGNGVPVPGLKLRAATGSGTVGSGEGALSWWSEAPGELVSASNALTSVAIAAVGVATATLGEGTPPACSSAWMFDCGVAAASATGKIASATAAVASVARMRIVGSLGTPVVGAVHAEMVLAAERLHPVSAAGVQDEVVGRGLEPAARRVRVVPEGVPGARDLAAVGVRLAVRAERPSVVAGPVARAAVDHGHVHVAVVRVEHPRVAVLPDRRVVLARPDRREEVALAVLDALDVLVGARLAVLVVRCPDAEDDPRRVRGAVVVAGAGLHVAPGVEGPGDRDERDRPAVTSAAGERVGERDVRPRCAADVGVGGRRDLALIPERAVAAVAVWSAVRGAPRLAPGDRDLPLGRARVARVVIRRGAHAVQAVVHVGGVPHRAAIGRVGGGLARSRHPGAAGAPVGGGVVLDVAVVDPGPRVGLMDGNLGGVVLDRVGEVRALR